LPKHWRSAGDVKGDILTPRERFGLLLIDERPDRCNIMPLITTHAAHAAGISLRKYYTDGKTMAQAQIAALDTYRHDAISLFSEVGIIAEAMGSRFRYPDDDLPVLVEPALAKRSLAALNRPDPQGSGRLPVYLEAIEYAYDAIGDRIPILAFVPAPFTTGMMLSDAGEFLMQTIRQPDHIRDIMAAVLQVTIDFCDHIINAGGLPVIVDPLASSSVVSPSVYENFALSSEKALIAYLHRYDLDIILHICGETEPIIDLLPYTGADLISLDRIDLPNVVERISCNMRIVGNFDTSTIAFSSPREIDTMVRHMIHIGMRSRTGYIVSTGCEVPIRTPGENIKAFIKAAKETAWYWD